MSNSILPIGSIVHTIETKNFEFMIVGYYPINPETSETYLYSAVLYPRGINGDSKIFFLNENDISEVLFTGYKSEQLETFVEYLDVVKQLQTEE